MKSFIAFGAAMLLIGLILGIYLDYGAARYWEAKYEMQAELFKGIIPR